MMLALMSRSMARRRSSSLRLSCHCINWSHAACIWTKSVTVRVTGLSLNKKRGGGRKHKIYYCYMSSISKKANPLVLGWLQHGATIPSGPPGRLRCGALVVCGICTAPDVSGPAHERTQNRHQKAVFDLINQQLISDLQYSCEPTLLLVNIYWRHTHTRWWSRFTIPLNTRRKSSEVRL